jgi:hypothetical protein
MRTRIGAMNQLKRSSAAAKLKPRYVKVFEY